MIPAEEIISSFFFENLSAANPVTGLTYIAVVENKPAITPAIDKFAPNVNAYLDTIGDVMLNPIALKAPIINSNVKLYVQRRSLLFIYHASLANLKTFLRFPFHSP